MFERYTERARRVIFFARYEALRRASQQIEPRDIVLGLTYDPHEPGCPFAKLHENAAELRALISPEPAFCGPAENRNLPLSDASKRALAYAEQEGRGDGRYSIGSDHLLRGVLRAGDETAVKMVSAGYTLSAMRKASKEAYRLNPDGRGPLGWRFKRLAAPLLLSVIVILFIAAILYLRSQN
jgi:ATP-dependent Clp protease ATP-binding subunit ClpC